MSAKSVLPILLFVVTVLSIVAWRVYEYRDCRRVGHSRLYCAVNR